MNQFRQSMSGQHYQAPPPPHVVGNPAFREFNKHHPSKFDGTEDPKEANQWIK